MLRALLRLLCNVQDLLNERERTFAAAEDADRLQAELAETQRRAADTERTLQAVRARSLYYSSGSFGSMLLGYCASGGEFTHAAVTYCSAYREVYLRAQAGFSQVAYRAKGAACKSPGHVGLEQSSGGA